jgi:hypothetical protein
MRIIVMQINVLTIIKNSLQREGVIFTIIKILKHPINLLKKINFKKMSFP